MFTSIGYHTFAVSMCLTQEDADRLFRDFKRYRDRTNEICIMGPQKYDKDPSGRHFAIRYLKHGIGITWKMRFSNKGFFINGMFMPCSVKAVINPKVLVGEKTYIVAANSYHLDDVERIFNQEAEKISPLLRRFDSYALNRIDYCINFDVSELEFNYPSELAKQLPELIITLMKHGDIPDHFSEEYKEPFQFYLKSKSVVINCYWKHDDLRRNFPDCQNLNDSYNIIRFEVQFKYPKAYSALSKLIKRYEHLQSVTLDKLKKSGFCSFSEDKYEQPKSMQLEQMYMDLCKAKWVIMKDLLSDDVCTEVIDDYYDKVIKKGDYYTFDAAKRIIEEKVSKWEKVVRLTETLKMISDYEGISKAKAALQGKELEEFRRSLRDLAKYRINPVTIPREWGIEHIPNLLDNYFSLRVKEMEKKRNEQFNREILEDYIKDCRRQGISLI